MSTQVAEVPAEAKSAAQPVVWKDKRRKFPIGRILFWIVVGIIIVYLLFPFYWVVKTSLTPDAHLYDTPVQYFPTNPTLDHYGNVFSNGNFVKALLNSTIVGASVTVLSLAIGASAAYALARFAFRGRSLMQYVILSMTIFPQVAILGALYQVIREFNLYNTLYALIISYMLFTLPFTVWVLASFFRGLPKELEEA